MDDPSLPPTPDTAVTLPATPLPWEDPSRGLLEGLFETFKLFALQPQEAFSRLSDIGIGRPFFYALIMAWIEVAVGFAYWFVFQAPFLLGIPALNDELAGAALGAGMMAVIAVVVFALVPVIVAIYLFIHTCILHLMLLILGVGRGGFEKTFRVLSYSHTADFANVIPLCGGLISIVWFIVLQVIGVAEAHRCSHGTAALAVLLPLFLCCACVVLLLSLGVGAGVLAALAEH